ncbi:hypothetical protein CRG98_045682 [Punica granatum]|uniref:F-box associated domain-containing protein n=1 Tax=Punica granatum TaxID=22663 RepID=A0A2I0HQE8_PUNGR|nr:hypothetical protein CRG98_045682 [Punica granatum]
MRAFGAIVYSWSVLVHHLIDRYRMRKYSKLNIKVLNSCDGVLLVAIFGFYFIEGYYSAARLQSAILDGDNKLVMRVPWTSETQMFVIDKQSGDWKEIAVDFKEFAPLGADEWAERDQYYIHHVNSLMLDLAETDWNFYYFLWKFTSLTNV